MAKVNSRKARRKGKRVIETCEHGVRSHKTIIVEIQIIMR